MYQDDVVGGVVDLSVFVHYNFPIFFYTVIFSTHCMLYLYLKLIMQYKKKKSANNDMDSTCYSEYIKNIKRHS